MKKFEMSFICEELQLDEMTIQDWINCRLVRPSDLSGPYFDEEDFSRIRLITEIKNICEANEESLEVILHLIDQIHYLTSELKKIKDQ